MSKTINSFKSSLYCLLYRLRFVYVSLQSKQWWAQAHVRAKAVCVCGKISHPSPPSPLLMLCRPAEISHVIMCTQAFPPQCFTARKREPQEFQIGRLAKGSLHRCRSVDNAIYSMAPDSTRLGMIALGRPALLECSSSGARWSYMKIYEEAPCTLQVYIYPHHARLAVVYILSCAFCCGRLRFCAKRQPPT